MSNGIELAKSLPTDTCFFCSKAKIHIESNQDKIKPSQFLLDLIHSDVSSSYLLNCLGAKYYVTFLDNYNKTSEVILLLSKDGVLSTFNLF